MSRLSRLEKSLFAILVAAGVGLVALRGPALQRQSIKMSIELPPVLLHPRLLQAMALDIKGGLSAVRWLQMLTVFGGDQLAGAKHRNERWLYQALISEIMLNPYHLDAYDFARAAFPFVMKRPEYALRLLAYGVTYRTQDWRILFSLGYLCFAELACPRESAAFWQLGSNLPDAPPYLASLSTMVAYSSNNIGTSLFFLDRTIEQWRGSEGDLVELLERREAFVTIVRLQQLVDGYKAAHGGAVPSSLWEIPGTRQIAPSGRDNFDGQLFLSEQGFVRSSSPELMPKRDHGDLPGLPEGFFDWENVRDLLRPLKLRREVAASEPQAGAEAVDTAQ